MKWPAGKRPEVVLTEWHKVFAWTPIQIDEYKYYLCWVMRRATVDDAEKQRENTYNSVWAGKVSWEYALPIYYY